MPFRLTRVCLFGPLPAGYTEGVRTAKASAQASDSFDISAHASDADLEQLLVSRRPQVLVSFGGTEDFPALNRAPLEIRKRWLHFPAPPEPAALGAAILSSLLANVEAERFPATPLVSVFTPTYLIGERIRRPFQSLLEQTYNNWEWVLYDDSPDDGSTYEQLRRLAQTDHRISAFRGQGPYGAIGEVKRRACGLCRGDILVELDHDDELTPNCLADIVGAFNMYPDAGFAYSDVAILNADGSPARFAPWIAELDHYREEPFRGRPILVMEHPGVCAKSIRALRGTPLHVRAWRRSTYHQVGGWSPLLHIADDHEIWLRTFLQTRIVHIARLGYLYYLNAATTANATFQPGVLGESIRLFNALQARWNARIHARLLELGVEDYMCRDGGTPDWSILAPASRHIANYTYR